MIEEQLLSTVIKPSHLAPSLRGGRTVSIQIEPAIFACPLCAISGHLSAMLPARWQS